MLTHIKILNSILRRFAVEPINLIIYISYYIYMKNMVYSTAIIP